MKDRFCREMLEAHAQALAEWKMIDVNERRNATFEAYWTAGATQHAEGFVPPDCADACRALGFEGLLEDRTIRLCVGATMSWMFSLLVGDGRQPRQPQPGDAYDLWHAFLGSAADVFVTRDVRLAGLLGRVPMQGFRVVTSISALLAEIH